MTASLRAHSTWPYSLHVSTTHSTLTPNTSLVFTRVGTDCKYTRRVFGPKSPSGTAVELDPSVGRFWSRKGVVTPGRFLRSWKGVFDDSGAVPRYGWASTTRRRRSDARGLSQHNRASLYNNPRRLKCLSGEKREDQKLLYSVITGKQSTIMRKRIEGTKSVSCHEFRGT